MKTFLHFSAVLLTSSLLGLASAQTATTLSAPTSAPATTAPMTAPAAQAPANPMMTAPSHVKHGKLHLRYLDAAGKIVRSPTSKKADPTDPAVRVEVSRAGQILATYPIVAENASTAQPTTSKRHHKRVMVNVNGQTEGLGQAMKTLK